MNRLWSPTYVMLIVGAFVEALSFTILFPIVPRFVSQAGGNGTDIGIVMGAFSFAAVFARPISGWLSDRFGRRPLLLAGAGLSIVAIIPITFVSSIVPLVALRILHGLGEATFYVASTAAVTDVVPPGRRAEGVSTFSLAFFAALGFGPWLGTQVAPAGFEAAFVLAAIAAGAALILAALIETPNATASAAFLLSNVVNVPAIFPGLLFTITLVGYAGFCSFIMIYADELTLSHGSWLFTAFAGTMVGVRLWGGNIPDRLGARPTAIGAMLAMSAGLGILGLHPTLFMAMVGTIAMAVGQALCFPALLLLCLSRAGEEHRGAAIGTLVAFLDIGVGLGAPAFGLIGAAAGYDIAFLVAALASFGAALTVWIAKTALTSSASGHDAQ